MPCTKTRRESGRGLTLWLIVAGVLVAVGVGGYYTFRPEPEPAPEPATPEQLKATLKRDTLEKLPEQKRGEELLMAGRQMAMLSREDRRKLWSDEKFREDMSKLKPEERRKLITPMRSRFREDMRESVRKFFEEKSEEKQNAMLDETLNRMQEWRKRREESRRSNPDGERPRRRRSGQSPEERQGRMRRRLDETTPEDRAMFQEYFRRLSERAEERGIEMPFGRGRR
jgi:hypothetical protein